MFFKDSTKYVAAKLKISQMLDDPKKRDIIKGFLKITVPDEKLQKALGEKWKRTN